MEPKPSPLKIAFALVALAIFLGAADDASRGNVINAFDLIVHEAGHWVFAVFGDFMRVAGGSLLQLVVPAVFAGYFWRRRDVFASGVTLMWLGLNFFDVAIYAADAIALDLPLLGGDSSGHDWNYLLRVSGTLAYTDAVAWSLRALGNVSLWGGFFLALWDGFHPKARVGRVW